MHVNLQKSAWVAVATVLSACSPIEDPTLFPEFDPATAVQSIIDEYNELMQHVRNFSPELRERIQLYEGDVPIFDRYGIEQELKKSLERARDSSRRRRSSPEVSIVSDTPFFN